MEAPDQRLRLLSYNIHVGARPSHYGHYVTRAWRHLLPGPGMHATLDQMAEMMQGHDFVAVQEADAGSLRTRFVNQLEYLAKRAGYSGVQEWLSFYFKSPHVERGHVPEHDLFIQHMRLKNTLRVIAGEEPVTHLSEGFEV